MRRNFRIIRNCVERCSHTGQPALTIYFSGKPTRRDMLAAAAAMGQLSRTRPNMSSPDLRVYAQPVDGLLRCQFVS